MEIKHILLSKTVWSALIIVGCSIAKIYGIELSDTDQSSLADFCVSIVTGISGLATIFFRYKANTKLSIK